MKMNREELGKYFTKDANGSVIFTGEECTVTITKKYENFGALNVDSGITTLGIFNLNINGADYGYILPAMIRMNPNHYEEVNDEYILTFKKGDVFFQTCTLVKRTDLVFCIFKIFVFFGYRYKFMTENNISRLFDNFDMTGFDMSYTYSSVISAMFSELYRNPENLQELNRHAETRQKGTAIGLKNVSLTATNLTTKLSGSYLKENMTSAVIQEHTQESEIENLLRR